LRLNEVGKTVILKNEQYAERAGSIPFHQHVHSAGDAAAAIQVIGSQKLS